MQLFGNAIYLIMIDISNEVDNAVSQNDLKSILATVQPNMPGIVTVYTYYPGLHISSTPFTTG